MFKLVQRHQSLLMIKPKLKSFEMFTGCIFVLLLLLNLFNISCTNSAQVSLKADTTAHDILDQDMIKVFMPGFHEIPYSSRSEKQKECESIARKAAAQKLRKNNTLVWHKKYNSRKLQSELESLLQLDRIEFDDNLFCQVLFKVERKKLSPLLADSKK